MKYNRRFSLEERKKILAEYHSGYLTQQELAFKYGISYPSLISKWERRLSESGKSVSLRRKRAETRQTALLLRQEPDMPKKEKKTPEEEIVELRSQLLQAKRELEWEKQRNLALETLIEVAEEQGMPVKKCGAKQ